MTLAANLDIKNFKKLCRNISPNIPVMVRGRHGIGKSQVVYQLAEDYRDDFYKNPENCKRVTEALRGEPSVARKLSKLDNPVWNYELGIPVIERRLSQMTEGDIIGLPFLEKNSTEFRPVLWLINGCEFPVILFLDELNRAMKGVEQATFQLADSKAFYGHTLHEGTRIFIAVNIGEQYNVDPFDPAAISRYAVVDLDPTVDDWINWAKVNCNSALVEFIRGNENALEHKESYGPNQKYPDRRAWGRLDAELTQSKLYDTPEDLTFLHLAASMVGFHYGNAFWNFIKEREKDISAQDILTDWEKTKARLPKAADKLQQKYVEMAYKVSDFITKNKLVVDKRKKINHAENLEAFIRSCPIEPAMIIWQSLCEEETIRFIQKHTTIPQFYIEAAQNHQGASDALSKVVEKQKEKEQPAPEKKEEEK